MTSPSAEPTACPTASPTPDPCPGDELALDNHSIHTAVGEWLDDMDAATTKYGPIACWNTSTVTDTIFLIIII
jgi:hypothetical protein